jgi:hypothetical protein
MLQKEVLYTPVRICVVVLVYIFRVKSRTINQRDTANCRQMTDQLYVVWYAT